MKTKNTDVIMDNKVFLWIILATGLLLSVPFMAMQFNWHVPDPGSATQDGVNWTLSDFIVMGTLIFGTSSMFIVAARKIQRKSDRVVVGVVLALAFLWLWIELAVGLLPTGAVDLAKFDY